MSPTDVPQVPSQHAGPIIGGNWPQTSETGTVASVIELFRHAAESVGTGDTAETMQALIEANASGHTPTALIAHFTAEQREAFDRALSQLNMAQGASVMAQDILNTKVALNGVVTSFEAAVDELLAEAAASPHTPKTQAEFERRYNELLDAATQQADMLGKNHLTTQDALASGVQKGTFPQIPPTMAPTSPKNPTVPGMPAGALGSVLQNVAGRMLSPQNLPMPSLGQIGQSISPLAQSAQAAIGQLMSSVGGAGVGGGGDALSVLTGSSRPAGPRSRTGAAGSPRAAPVAGAPEPPAVSLSGAAPQNITAPGSAAQAEPAVTAAPGAHVPATTLSSTHTAEVADTPSPARTPASAADVAAAPQPAPAAGAAAPLMPMASIGGSGASPTPAAGGAASTALLSSTAGVRRDFEPHRPTPAAELTGFGPDPRGLEHATDTQLVAASVLAALVRAHDRAGVQTEIAVGVGPGAAVFATSDGLGFIPPGVCVSAHIVPLVNRVPDGFIARWLGCDQPWRPLLEAATLNLAGPFATVATTDAGAAAFGVLTLTPDEIAAVGITAGTQDRWTVDAVDAEDVQPALAHLVSVWGRAPATAPDLRVQAAQARWTGAAGPGVHPRRWARHLIAAAAADLAAGNTDDARYTLRCALRIPAAKEDRP